MTKPKPKSPYIATYYQEWKDGIHLRDITKKEFWVIDDDVARDYEYIEKVGHPAKCLK